MLFRHYDNLGEFLRPGKALVIYGPRQVGKTTLINTFLHETTYKYRLDSGENLRIAEILSSGDFEKIKDYVGDYELIVIDEAQKIPNIGSGLKIIVDLFPNIVVIATGSSSFDLAGQLGEPLTGRKRTLRLFPLSQLELAKTDTRFELKENLENYLIYGSYPEVLTAKTKKEKIIVLNELTSSYLLKDIIALDKIRNNKLIFNLLRLIAFQVGSEVSLSELAKKLGIDYKTVGRYIDILEKSFILFSLHGFSRNLRKEMTKKHKYYFYDNGIRNALISNFNALELRDDCGKLWENFLFTERVKRQVYQEIFSNNYFWRTWDQKEIDFVEERDGKLYGYEFKWGKKNPKPPKEWFQTYKEATYEIVNRDNYLDFIVGERE